MPTHRLLASLALVLLLLAGLLPPFAVHVAAAPPVYDLLIRNGLVVDGTGAQPYHGTPCVTEHLECNGPPPVFGGTPPPD